MKRCLIVLALFAAACGSQPTSSDSKPALEQPPTQADVRSTTPSGANRNGPVVNAPAAAPAGPTIPQGARFTIFCESFTGDDHVQRATTMKNVMVKSAKVKDWYIIHQDGQSTLYHGYYREFDAANATDSATKKEVQRAQNDKKMVESLPVPGRLDQRLFPRALFVSLDSPDPDAPPEWNLVNAKGYWSVEIAVYSGVERKQLAVESVRDARGSNIPAYYYHGPSYSSVCIGVWPRTAVNEQSTEQINTIRQGSDVFVDVRGGGISPEMRQNLMRDGKPIEVVVPKVEILDQSLLATLRAYPEHHVDGIVEMERVVDPANKAEVRKPKHSLLVRIPAEGTSTASGGGESAPEPRLIQPTPTNNNLGARLRGLNP